MFDIFYYGPKPNLFAFEKPASSLDDAAAQSKTSHYWYIYGHNDYTGFDFDVTPVPWEAHHIYVYPSQWQRDGGVYLANKSTVQDRVWHFRKEQSVKRLPDMTNWIIPYNADCTDFDFSWHPDAHEPDYEYHFPTQHQRDGGPIYKGTAGIKYETEQKIRANATQIFYMDFLNPESEDQFQLLQQEFPDIKRTRYVSDHLNVLKRIANMATTEFVWVISSICDYNFFDFTWHPPEEQREMIHCFANNGNGELRGDTFYIHVPSFKTQMIDLELLDWFNVINYIPGCHIERWPLPTVHYTGDNLIAAIKQHEFKTPYAMFTNDPNLNSFSRFSTCLWTEKDRVARDLSTDKSTCLIPRDVKQYIKTQVYDYPYLETSKNRNVRYTPDLDIVYISNGEPDEERWYNHACYQSNRDVKWIRGVNGRVAAYQAAAQASTTDWFLTVFAKLEVLGSEFDWHWQPDYWQGPKHYIFNARNPVNGLEYGHMGMIAYNKRLVLENNTPGIDFTLSQPHESVPMLSGVAHFNQDAWTTWRTAFREVLKLRLFMTTQPTLETEHRLNTWLTQAQGNYSNYCLDGARDAVEYYEEVGGDPAQLQLSFEWAWLRARYDAKY